MSTHHEGAAELGGAESSESENAVSSANFGQDTTKPSEQSEAQQPETTQNAPVEASGASAEQTTDESQDDRDNDDTQDGTFPAISATSLLFHAPDLDEIKAAAKAKKAAEESEEDEPEDDAVDDGEVVARRRRRRRRGGEDLELTGGSEDDPPNTVTKVRTPRVTEGATSNKVTSVKGSTRLEAKRQRRRDSRASGRRRHVITEAEFLARRESVDRQMIVRQKDDRIQIGVLEDGVLSEHFVSKTQQDSLIGNVYLGKVQNVLPSMEAAFVDIGRGRNAVLYAGEVNWDSSGLDGAPRKIENALKSGDSVLVQVTKDPIGHKGARLTSQISLPGRYLVYVPGGSMTGISRKLPDTERARLKKILKDKLPEGAGVIVRTAAEGAAEEELAHDINRLRAQWEDIESKSTSKKTLSPEMLYQEPDLTIKTVRDVFNEDFSAMVVQGEQAWDNIEAYVTYVAPDLLDRLKKWDGEGDLFDHYRVEEGLAKALDRKVFLPSGGSLVIDRTEAMTVVDVNTGKFTGSGGNLEETVTKNNLEAAEEIVRQLRLRDIGGIIVIDFIDMVLEQNRDLVLRRLIECLGRDRTKHQVAEVTSLGLVQMTRKRMGTGLLDVFSEPCEHCGGRGVIVHDQPLKGRSGSDAVDHSNRNDRKRHKDRNRSSRPSHETPKRNDAQAEATRNAVANIAAASAHHDDDTSGSGQHDDAQTVRPESGESKSAKKRKRRKRNKDRQAEATRSQDSASQSSQRNADSSEDQGGALTDGNPDMVVTIQGEVVNLPQSEKGGQRKSTRRDDSQLSLDSLNAAFDGKSSDERKSSDADADQSTPDTVSTTDRARRRAEERREASRARSGRQGAEAARKAALEALEDMRPGRNRRQKPSEDTTKSESRSNRRGDTNRRRPNRQETPDPAKATVTGVAVPGSGQASVEEKGASNEPTASIPTSATGAPEKPKKRRVRRAASSGSDGEIQTGISGAASGGSVSSTTYRAPESEKSESQNVTMLGVGVTADEIQRPE
ncbi:Rne/Rng family ribonuclease [Kocuria sp. HSID16901]|uniref:Rne/Rng family ribonuclease n=1 Tax=Kocuria sp. HSID16901 TaxID=2419505 RepID=UPI0009E2B95A|nr:Rne/Rng family ribonuclease [Kocuria sp. HSID16901]RUQ22523.1 Rne/Rng family ribonuclease [Kocuria sp. HSID16901]